MTAEMRLLSAALRGAEPERDRIVRAEFGGRLPAALLTAAFTVAARRRFPADVDRRAVAAFAHRFVTGAPGGATFRARDAEAALRGVTGEIGLLHLPGLTELMWALLHALADDLELNDGDVEALLAEAGREAAAAAASAELPDAEPVDVRRYRRTHRRLLTADDLRPARAPRPHRPKPTGVRGGEPATRAGRHLLHHLLPGASRRASGDVADGDRFLIMRATLAEALWDYLPEDPELPEIAALVQATGSVSQAEVDPMKAEYIARLIMGEQVSLDGFTKRDIYQNGAAMLQVVLVHWGLDAAVISSLIIAAEASLARQGKRLAT